MSRRRSFALGLLFVIAYGAARLFVPLPGIDARHMPTISAFEIGPMPFLWASLLVELVAWALPALRSLRDGEPAARARLERASTWIATALAVFQAFAMVRYVAAFDGFERSGSPAAAAVTLVAGTSVSLLVAGAVRARGVPAAMVGLALVWALPHVLRTKPADVFPVVLACAVAFVLGLVVAVHARRRARGWIPVPAGTIVAPNPVLVIVTVGSISGASMGMIGELVRSPIGVLGTAAVSMLAIAYLLHRPIRTRPSAALLGAFAFAIATSAAATSLLDVAKTPYLALWITVAIVWLADVIEAFRAAEGDDVVVLRSSTRPAEASALVDSLSAHGIDASARGLATSSLFQVFGPFAPVDVVVPREHLERARTIAAEPLPRDEAAPSASWATQGVLVVAAVVAVVGLHSISSERIAPSKHQRALAVRAIDDEKRPFDDLDEATLPKGASLQSELAPTGVSPSGDIRHVPVRFVRFVAQPNESKSDLTARVEPWIAAIAAQNGVAIGLGEVVDYDPSTEKTIWVGLRTYVLSPDVILTERDVRNAVASVSDARAKPEYYVAIELEDQAAARFADATARLVKRRLAIQIDGEVSSAPVVQGPIKGGHVSITLGAHGTAAEAKALAHDLGG